MTNQKTSGIYKIVNKINKKCYIGSSNDIKRRWKLHRYQLKLGIHYNDYLQNSWNKYGENNFDFLVIEEFPANMIIKEEQKYLDVARETPYKYYNLKFVSFGGGEIRNYSKMKISKSMSGQNHPFFGKHHTDETRKKISECLTGKYKGEKSPHYGKKHTIKTKKKISDALKGRTSPNKGKLISGEQKEKIRKSILKIRDQISETRAKNWVFCSPQKQMINIHNLNRFCKDNELQVGHMHSVFNGKRSHHKGWTKWH